MMKRIQLLDALRGLSIILMLGYHLGYDLVVFGFIPEGALYNPVLNTLEPIFAGIFIVLAGISSHFSHNNLKRGVYVLGGAALVSAAGYLVGSPIWFGILHLLACCILLYALLEKLKITFPVALIGAFLVCFFEIGRWPVLESYDYFPIVPWAFLFFFGAWLGKPIKEKKLPDWFYNAKIPFFPAVGRHTMIIYLVHQPVLYGAAWLAAKLLGRV